MPRNSWGQQRATCRGKSEALQQGRCFASTRTDKGCQGLKYRKSVKTTHGNEELLDLLQGVPHAGVGLRWRGEDFDEHVEVVVEVEVLRFPTFPQLFLLKKDKWC